MTGRSEPGSAKTSAPNALTSRISRARSSPSARPIRRRRARSRARSGRGSSESWSRKWSTRSSTRTRLLTLSPPCRCQPSTRRIRALRRHQGEREMFARWGRFVYRFRWATLAGSGVLLAVSVAGLLMGGTLTSGGPLTSNLESARAGNLITSDLKSGSPATSNFVLVFSSTTLSVGDPAYKDAVTAALAPIQGDSHISSIVTPYNAPNARVAQAFTSTNGHQALVSVDLKSTGMQARKDYDALRAQVHSDTLTVMGTGFVAINEAFNKTLEADLQRAEFVTLPLTLLLLVIIFASLVAAGLPLGVGVLTIIGGLAGTFFLNRFTDVSQYALNIVTLIGLGVSIDYSLFIVNRFRDELAAGASREDAIATTMATAGRAITFSGITVAVGLSAMLFYQGTFMASMGAAGAIVVAVAVIYGLTFLPALLSIIGPAVNRLRIPIFRGTRTGGGFWRGLATWVMRRPIVVLLPTTGFLLLAASPFVQLRLANGDVDMLPTRLEARQGYDQMINNFPGQDQTTFNIVVDYPAGSPQTPARISAQSDLALRIAAIPGVLHVTTAGAGAHIVLIQATTASPATSDASRAIVNSIPALQGGAVELPLHRRLFRRPGVDLPAGTPFDPARLHPSVDRPEHPRDPVLDRVLTVDGLRGAAREPHPRGVCPHWQQHAGGRARPREDRAPHHRRRGDHGHRVPRLRSCRGGDHQSHRHRAGDRGRPRRHAGSGPRRAGGHATARRMELVGAPPAAAVLRSSGPRRPEDRTNTRTRTGSGVIPRLPTQWGGRRAQRAGWGETSPLRPRIRFC